MITLFDLEEYEEIDYEFTKEDLSFILDEEAKFPRGKVTGYIFLSKRSSMYGSISNNGAKGIAYKDNTPSLLNAILEIVGSKNSNNLKIKNDKGILKAVFFDHDGTDVCTIHPVIKSKKDKVDSMSKDLNSSFNFQKFIEYAEGLPLVKTNSKMKGVNNCEK